MSYSESVILDEGSISRIQELIRKYTHEYQELITALLAGRVFDAENGGLTMGNAVLICKKALISCMCLIEAMMPDYCPMQECVVSDMDVFSKVRVM